MLHASAVQRFREADGVAVSRNRGVGCAGPDYMLQFVNFNTFVADVQLKDGCFYFEVLVVEIVGGAVQFGFCSGGFESRDRSHSVLKERAQVMTHHPGAYAGTGRKSGIVAAARRLAASGVSGT